MKRYLKLATICTVFLMAASMSAFAGSINDSFSGAALVGVSGTASGGFTFDTSTDKFSGISLSFYSSAFGGTINASDQGGGKAQWCNGNLCAFAWQTKVGNNSVWNTIVINVLNGQYQDFGGIFNWQNHGAFNYLSAPEGGVTLAYLLLSAIAVFGAIFISGKQRLTTH